MALEASATLLNVSDFAPNACKLACTALVKVANTQKDINIRLSILDIFLDIRRRCPIIFEDYAVDVLRCKDGSSTGKVSSIRSTSNLDSV